MVKSRATSLTVPFLKKPKWSSKAAAATTRRGVSHCGLAIYIKKVCLKEKRRIMETQIFHHAKKKNLQKIL
jgi:hypothetical protein